MDVGGTSPGRPGEPPQVHLYWYPVSPTARAAAIVLNMLSTTKVTPVFHIVDLFKGTMTILRRPFLLSLLVQYFILLLELSRERRHEDGML